MRDITVDPVTRTAVVPARPVQRRGEEGRRRTRPVVPAGPVVVRDLQHRRQHRHQRRRAVLREVRRHHRLRAGPAGGAGRRHRGAAGRPAAERRCGPELTKLFVGSEGTLGIVTEITLRLLPKQHRSSTRGGHLRHGRGGRRRRARRHRADAAVDAGVHGRASPSTPSRTS